jgi:epoxyqueuosine reductase
MDQRKQKELINKLANEFKFDVCRVTDPNLPNITSLRLKEFINLGFHGDMKWLEKTFERRKSPTSLWEEAKSAIVVGINYGPKVDPLTNNNKKLVGNISVYAQGRDYHEIIKGRLKLFSSKLISRLDKEKTQIKVFVDTAPLMEKPLAQKAGIGWQGKHTNLVSKEFGSWLFLGVILLNTILEYDNPEHDHCGSCRACINICPTNAFLEPYKLDATKCISYLTIENKKSIPKEFRKAIGNKIFGCDDCLAICPWNKYAQETKEIKFINEKQEYSLLDLLKLSDQSFRVKFSKTPIKRIGRDRFIRNCCIAAGNSKSKSLIPQLENLILNDQSELVRGAAVWAIQQLGSKNNLDKIKSKHLSIELNNSVIEEWIV